MASIIQFESNGTIATIKPEHPIPFAQNKTISELIVAAMKQPHIKMIENVKVVDSFSTRKLQANASSTGGCEYPAGVTASGKNFKDYYYNEFGTVFEILDEACNKGTFNLGNEVAKNFQIFNSRVIF